MKLDLTKTNELKTAPIFDGLPEALKDKNSYAGIERQIALVMYSDHKHASVKGFVRCKRCSAKIRQRRELLISLGFKGYEQYLQWRRVMEIITNEKDFELA